MPRPTKTNVNKVSVQCPHCGAHQLEPALAQSTYCRACSLHFEIGGTGREEPPEDDKDTSRLWSRFTGLFRDNSPKIVSCFECGTRQEVVRTATSSSCKTCGSFIDLQDFKITSAFSRSIQTAGTIYLTSKGDLNSAKAICGEIEMRGSMRGHLLCTGEAKVRYKGRITGGIETDILRVEKKSNVEFVRPVRAREVHIEGTMSGRILAAGTVYIAKSGCVSGSIFARGINIERGGVFAGDLSIGDNSVEEPGELPPLHMQHSAVPKNDRQSELGFN